jgi:hypothetical protein
MTSLKPLAALAAMLAAVFVAGCAGIPQDDRYQTHDGGRSNTRAERSNLHESYRSV